MVIFPLFIIQAQFDKINNTTNAFYQIQATDQVNLQQSAWSFVGR